MFGEVYGGNPKIQNLTYDKPDSLDVVFFDLMIDGKYVDFKIFKDFCLKNNLPIVPILYIGPFSKEVLQKYTEGLTNIGKGVHITEGCIVKPIVESYSNHCGRKVLKSINPEYLLTKDEDNEHFAH